MVLEYVAIGLGLVLVSMSVKIIRPIEEGVVERFGKWRRNMTPGLHIIIPFVDRMIKVNLTERMVDIQPQTVITKDKLNTVVDAVVYYKVNDVKKVLYNVDDHQTQLVSLARTTLRAVIGKMTLAEANEDRARINSSVEGVLDKETASYGVEVLRVELQKIDPPEDVQDSMNKVVKAEQEKIAAKDLATARETEADGIRRAEIKKAEGVKRATILQAEGTAQAKVAIAEAEAQKIKLENEAIQKYFKNEAQTYKALKTIENAFKSGTKFVIDSKSNLINVMNDLAGTNVVPVTMPEKKRKS